MNSYEKMVSQLNEAYQKKYMFDAPDWAVHKRNLPEELVRPTIPFVGKKYATQNPKILVYASAENLSEYWKGNDKHWPEDWLDDDVRAMNRHRNCFDDKAMQKNKILPYVHCGPMDDGGLLTAIMYLASKLRDGCVDEPYTFYETIAFGNYGKFSIETELQRTIRSNPQLSNEEKKHLKKYLKRCNIDYATMLEYLKVSRCYVEEDIIVLKPDVIIMPNINDNGFIDSIKGNAKVIRIHQINGTVVNNMAPNKRNHFVSKYTPRDIDGLPLAVKQAYNAIRGINKENYRYVFDYLDKVYELALLE